MFQRFQKFASDDSAATMIEYGLIAALVSLACIGGIRALGASGDGLYDRVFIQTIIPALK